MYGILLLIFKIVSDALAAFFGVLGLLFEFKDKHNKITRIGGVALSGIFASFVVSGIITGLEAKKSHDEAMDSQRKSDALAIQYQELRSKYEQGQKEIEAANAREMSTVGKKVLRPFEHLFVDIGFAVDRPRKPEKTDYLEMLLHVPSVWALYFSKAPIPCGLPSPSLYASHGEIATDLRLALDMIPGSVENDPSLGGKYYGVKAGVDVRRFSPLRITDSGGGNVSSVDDIAGSTLLIESIDPTYRSSAFDYRLSYLRLDLREGVSVELPKAAFPLKEFHRVAAKDFSYQKRIFCYTFPADAGIFSGRFYELPSP
jgi:hypothetical protein